MSDFSDYLDNYMEENCINSAELARGTDMERTLIWRYRRGERAPSDASTVLKIADALCMNVSEKEKLMEKYDRLKLGDQAVDSFLYTKKLLSGLADVKKKPNAMCRPVNLFRQRQGRQITHIYSGDEIIDCISGLFFYAVEKKETAYIIMQPVYDSVQRLLGSFFRETQLSVVQIMCLEQGFMKNHKNLEIFEKAIPLCFGGEQYEIRYYYDFLTHHINAMSWMPNVIIAGEYVLSFDFEMRQGVLVRDAGYRDSMWAEFQKMHKESVPFLVTGEDMMNTFHIFEKAMPGKGGGMSTQPCVGFAISSDIYRSNLIEIDGKELFIEAMVRSHGDWKDGRFVPPEGMKKEALYSYCQESAIRRFMETGRAEEFPPDFYEPLDEQMRRDVLFRLIWLIKNGYICCFFIPEEIELPRSICFYWHEEEKQIVLCQIGSAGISQIVVREPGIYQSFQYFFDYLRQKGKLRSGQEVLETLEALLREYGGKE